MNKIGCKMIGRLRRPGESCIVGPCRPGTVSTEFLRHDGKYTQKSVLVIDPVSGECVKMFLVTRLS